MACQPYTEHVFKNVNEELTMNKSKLAIALSACALTFSLSFVADACTRAAYQNGDASIVVRTMDWWGHDDAVVKGHGKGI